MSKVLLINPSYQQQYGGNKLSVVNPIYPTLGLATIAAEAEKRGHVIRILDLSWRQYDYRFVSEEILDFHPDIVGITVTTTLMNQARDISVLVKDIAKKQGRKITVVAGGPHIAALPKESILESLIDVAFTDEADYSFGDLCDGIGLNDIKGIYYRDGNEVISTGRRTPIHSLDDLEMPAWHLYDPNDYCKISKILCRRTPATMAEFSRGCVFKCDFCASKQTMGLGYRKKSPARCAEEVERLYQLGFREFLLADDIFTSDVSWAAEVCEEIIKKDVDMLWTCANGIRVESADRDLFELLKAAGCYRVSFGFESGNDEILRSFGKGGKASIEQGRRAVATAKKAKIETLGFFMFGLSADTKETMQDTINYAKSIPINNMKFGICIAFPGTPMFDVYAKNNWIKSYNWDEYFIYTDKALFTHPTLSYEEVREFVKIGFRKAMFFNPRFLFRRLLQGLRTGDFFWDVYYGFTAIFLPSVGKFIPCEYYAKARWPKYDFHRNKIDTIPYQVVRKKEDKSILEIIHIT